MPNNYLFLDADGSILTARSSITAGSAHEPYVQITSFLSTVPTTPSGNQSISGTVQLGGTVISSLVSTVPSSVLVGTSIFGQLPGGTATLGSVTALQGTNPWVITGSIQGTSTGNSSVQVLNFPGITSLVSTVPSSVLVGASIFGQLPAGTAPLGSVAALQGTNPWNMAGSVAAFQAGTKITSIVSSIPSSVLVGTYAHRNDAVASFLGADLTWRPLATDSAGRTLNKPFAAEESRVEGYGSTVSTSQMTLVAAAGAGLRNYITDVWIANTGAAAALVTFKDGANSILGYTIAPAGSGSNLPGLQMPIRTGLNATFDVQPGTASSIIYATVKGFKAP